MALAFACKQLDNAGTMRTELQNAIVDDAAPAIEDPAIDDEQDFAETNVIEQAVASTSSQSAMKTHSDVAFHSPAREKILGTPFATDSSRFEYPFPNASSDPILSSSISTLPASAPTNHSYPTNGLSPSPTATTSFSPLFSSSFPASFPTYTLTHPKMRATPPPIPPSLKKRQRSSLTIPILRRRNSHTNEIAVPEESHLASSDGTQVAVRNS